jgi:hypothetical protein
MLSNTLTLPYGIAVNPYFVSIATFSVLTAMERQTAKPPDAPAMKMISIH